MCLMTLRNTFAIQLFRLRTRAGMSQGELGIAAGTCRTMINRYESGRSTPEIGNLVLLADALDVSVDVLLGRNRKKSER